MMTNPHGLLAGKIAIITGGASGIGRSTVIRFVQEGAKVTIVDLDEVEGRKLETELNAEHQKQVSIFVKADVSSSADAQKIVEETVSAFGTVDVLFNNAGIQPAKSNVPLHMLDESMWDAVINVNLKSVFVVSKAVLPIMLAKSSGVIINNSSVQGIMSQKGVPAYAASKGGCNSLTRNMALDYAPHIRVLAVCPGAVDTPLHREQYDAKGAELDQRVHQGCTSHPLQRPGRTEEIAHAVVFLASDRASFMTGCTVPVDGGLLARGAWAQP